MDGSDDNDRQHTSKQLRHWPMESGSIRPITASSTGNSKPGSGEGSLEFDNGRSVASGRSEPISKHSSNGCVYRLLTVHQRPTQNHGPDSNFCSTMRTQIRSRNPSAAFRNRSSSNSAGQMPNLLVRQPIPNQAPAPDLRVVAPKSDRLDRTHSEQLSIGHPIDVQTQIEDPRSDSKSSHFPAHSRQFRILHGHGR
ncbi:hypothetical protein ACLOJK_038857 [Asimina triloba]